MKQELYDLIINELNQQLEEKIEISRESLLREDLGLPSIKLVFFITSITRSLNISILDFYDYELLNLKSVEDVYCLLNKKLSE